jgi:hypothetical protein
VKVATSISVWLFASAAALVELIRNAFARAAALACSPFHLVDW